MADPVNKPQQQTKPGIGPDESSPQMNAFAEPRVGQLYEQRRHHGPQLWAVILTLGGLYHLWTRILGKSLPSFAQRGNRTGAKGHGGGGSSNRQAEIQAVRERQQQRLQNANRAHEMANQACKNGNVRERTFVSSANNNSTLTIQKQQQLLRQNQKQKQEQQEREEKKKKQRQLYLKQKALKEKEEETRKKDEELGPGWRYREDPNAATNALNNMDPQGGSGGGGFKAQTRKRGG